MARKDARRGQDAPAIHATRRAGDSGGAWGRALMIPGGVALLLVGCHPQPRIVGLRTVCVEDSCWTIATYSDGSILRWPVEEP